MCTRSHTMNRTASGGEGLHSPARLVTRSCGPWAAGDEWHVAQLAQWTTVTIEVPLARG